MGERELSRSIPWLLKGNEVEDPCQRLRMRWEVDTRKSAATSETGSDDLGVDVLQDLQIANS
jgi:sigma54-dependent transcription regulator